jgi:predicted DsbA family dithiol-disulfide isomerase
MPCLIALVVLSVFSIFSASHRKLAKEAFECVFRRARLQPCDTGFDVKIKSKVLGSLINRSPKIAKYVSRHFELVAWILVIGLTISSVYTLRGLYYYYAWGSCGGANSSSFCVFDPSGENNQTSTIQTECSLEETTANDLSLMPVDLSPYPTIGQGQSNLTLIGCYSCPYTREAFPRIDAMIKEQNLAYRFVHFPVHQETLYLTPYDYCVRRLEPRTYSTFVSALMNEALENIADESFVVGLIDELGFDREAVVSCVQDETRSASASAEIVKIETTGIYGTPTVFVDETAVVGPKPDRVYKRLLRGGWF